VSLTNIHIVAVETIKTTITESGGIIELSFKDGSGCIMEGSGTAGTIDKLHIVRGKRGNYAQSWLTFYFADKSADDQDAFINLLNNVVHPFLVKVYEK
jgi:hypothetical protein